MKIVLANWKGGAAKTTTALAIHHAMLQAGLNTCYVDYDPQASGSVHKASNGVVYRDPGKDYDFEICDTPPNNADILRPLVLSAACVLVPLAPTSSDFAQLVTTLKLLRSIDAKRPVGIVIQKYNTRSERQLQIIDLIKDLAKDNNVPVLDPVIKERTEALGGIDVEGWGPIAANPECRKEVTLLTTNILTWIGSLNK